MVVVVKSISFIISHYLTERTAVTHNYTLKYRQHDSCLSRVRIISVVSKIDPKSTNSFVCRLKSTWS